MTTRNYNVSFPRTYLKTVACELRFPPLLKIEQRIPDFQETIRESLPEFSTSRKFMDLKIGEHPAIISQPSEFGFDEFKDWHFIDETNQLDLKVSINSISLSSGRYQSFQQFYSNFCNFIDNFISLVDVHHLTRIGLRYINDIPLERNKTLSEQVLMMFNPPISSRKIEKFFLVGFNSLVSWRVEDRFTINVRNNLSVDRQGNPRYVIDIDVFEESIKKPPQEYTSIIPKLHELAVVEFYDNVMDVFLEKLKGES